MLRLSATAGLGLATLSLGACGRPGLRLVGSRGNLPSAWTSRLPRPWQVTLLDDPAAVVKSVAASRSGAEPTLSGVAMLQLDDGWAEQLSPEALQPIGTAALLARLVPLAGPVSRLHRAAAGPALAFPWSVSPWVLVLRDRSDLARRAAEGWSLLLDPSLRGRLVLPSSPRVSLALVDEDPERLRQLRAQALAYDDRDSLSLLLDGHAEAAVLPRQRVIPLLRRDPRLSVVLPEQGGPVSWNLLLSPAGAPAAPLEWLGEALEVPLLTSLLTAGWVPPLAEGALRSAVERFPATLRSLLLPPATVQGRWRDLPPLNSAERQRLQALWDSAAPEPAAR